MTSPTVQQPVRSSDADLNEDERCTWASLQTMVAVVDQAIDHDLVRETGLTQSYMRILCQLASTPGGTLRMSEVAAANGLSPSRTSHAAARSRRTAWSYEVGWPRTEEELPSRSRRPAVRC